MRLTFPNASALLPTVTVAHLLCENLDFHLTDIQLQGAVDIVQNIVHIVSLFSPAGLSVASASKINLALKKLTTPVIPPTPQPADSSWGWPFVSYFATSKPAPAVKSSSTTGVPSMFSFVTYVGVISLSLYSTSPSPNTRSLGLKSRIARLYSIDNKLELLSTGNKLSFQVDVDHIAFCVNNSVTSKDVTCIQIGGSSYDVPDYHMLADTLFQHLHPTAGQSSDE
jgi:hypothetical protein